MLSTLRVAFLLTVRSFRSRRVLLLDNLALRQQFTVLAHHHPQLQLSQTDITQQCRGRETSAEPDYRYLRSKSRKLVWMSPMRGDVKERISPRPLREVMDVVICIQPDLMRSGEALCSRHASHRPRQSTESMRRFHNLMVRRLRSGGYASNPGWLQYANHGPILFETRSLQLFSVMRAGIE